MIAWRRLAIVFGLAWYAGSMALARQSADDSILEAIARVEQQAARARTASAEFTVTYLPTSPAEMERITAFCKQRGYEYRSGSYYCSAHQARRRSYHSIWFRSGTLEREEKTYIARPAIVETTVFDGQLVRTLDGTPGRCCLHIASPETTWTHKNRIQPFAFSFEFRSASLGEIIRQSTDRRVASRQGQDDGRWEVTVRHPSEERLTLRLVYDAQFRLLVREAILTQSTPLLAVEHDEPTVYARQEFSNYKPYDDGQGRQIWFPSQAILRYNLGKLLDGSPVQSYALRVDVKDIEFNGPIAAEKFKIEVPEGVPVRDHRQDGYATIAVSY